MGDYMQKKGLDEGFNLVYVARIFIGGTEGLAAPPGGVTTPPFFISKLGTYKTIALITENAQHNNINY